MKGGFGYVEEAALEEAALEDAALETDLEKRGYKV